MKGSDHGITLAKALGNMADAALSAKLGPRQRFFSRECVDNLVQLLRDAESAIIVMHSELRRIQQEKHCACGVPDGTSHYCSSLNHAFVGKRTPAEEPAEHLSNRGWPIDGYPRQQE